jgi:hypothetical protein
MPASWQILLHENITLLHDQVEGSFHAQQVFSVKLLCALCT